MRPIIVIEIAPLQRFDAHGYKDDRDGCWCADIFAYKADPDTGDLIDYITADGCSMLDHSGLWRDKDHAHHTAKEKAFAMINILRLTGKKMSFILDRNRPKAYNDPYLDHYLWEREEKAHRKATAAALRQQAKDLLEQARMLA